MSNPLWWATLNPSSPRYKAWRAILDCDDVPLRHPGAQKATLGVPIMERAAGTPAREEDVEVYSLDLHALNESQLRRLVVFVSEKFKTPVEEVAATICVEGFPIRAEDVIVAFSMRAFL